MWEGEHAYDPKTGEGAIGVELAGTAVSSTGVRGTVSYAREQAGYRVGNSTALQWNEGYYRGYFVVGAGRERLEARYYGVPTVAERAGWELPLANFTVRAGENRLRRPVAGARVEAGYLKFGDTRPSNVSLDTASGAWDVVGFDVMYLNTTSTG